MDLPYLAVLWNPLDPAQTQDAARVLDTLPEAPWRAALQDDGLAVFTRTIAVPYLDMLPLPDGKGTVLGVLFDSQHNHCLSAREIQSDPALRTGGTATARHLAQHYWGGYVVLLSPQHRNGVCVFRDPSGMIPCYYTNARGITLVSSDARNFLSLESSRDTRKPLLSIDINWQYLAGFLAHSQLQIRETGLKNVYELLAGEALCNRAGRQSVELLWSPAAFTETDPWGSLDARCEALHHTVQSCINAWASVHDWVVHGLSGGFDSSLLLALLNRAPERPNVVCVNRYSSGPAEDERHYARIAAQAAETPLVEWPWDFGQHALDTSCLSLPFGAKPSITALLSSLEAPFFAALKAAHRFDAIWTGEGGDHLFLALNTESTVTDFLRIRGFGTGLLQVLQDTARLTGRSIPHLTLNMIRRQRPVIRNAHETAAMRNTLLAATDPARRHLNDYVQHPWAQATCNVPPGKRTQILLLAEVLHRLRPLPATQEGVELQPLLSQPVIEQCLRIPTYELLFGGRTRSLARKAFSREIPAEILNRELKGQTTHHALGLFYQSRPFISGLLMNGVLMQQGLLEHAALEPLVSGAMPISAPRLFPLFASVAAEAWTRHWLGIHAPCDVALGPAANPSHSTSPSPAR